MEYDTSPTRMIDIIKGIKKMQEGNCIFCNKKTTNKLTSKNITEFVCDYDGTIEGDKCKKKWHRLIHPNWS